jgi:hypothetical protein
LVTFLTQINKMTRIVAGLRTMPMKNTVEESLACPGVTSRHAGKRAFQASSGEASEVGEALRYNLR